MVFLLVDDRVNSKYGIVFDTNTAEIITLKNGEW